MGKKPEALLAMVALSSDLMPQQRDILAILSRRFPDCPAPADVEQAREQFVFPFGGNTAAIRRMPGPIPWRDLEGPCETAWWWPQASECMSRHTHHVLVALMGGAGDAKERHVRLSHLVAAVARQTNATGIYWGNGTLVHEPEAFQKQVAGLTTEHLVPHLWIDMRVEENDDGTHRFFTTGMSAFSQLEIEIERSDLEPESLLDICYPTIDYILTSGTKIQHGETIGRSAEEKFRVTHESSMFESRNTVMKLALE